MFCKILLLQIAIVSAAPSSLIIPLTLTGGNCEKNISLKYQVPVTRTRNVRQNSGSDLKDFTENYIDYEERTRWDTVHMCCPGYRTIIFGLCEPVCENGCPEKSYCVEPNKCDCIRGYESSHHPNQKHQLICRPICVGGCPDHSHCVAYNKCECRAGFRDTSAWFAPLKCERIQCAAPDQRYDVNRHGCVKIEMTVEELMQKVGEKLSHGFGVTKIDFESGMDIDDDIDINEKGTD